jgi:hypothetical protein
MDILERFFSKVKINNNGCWEWEGGTDKEGYGHFKSIRTHRLCYESFKGLIPPGKIIHHICGNKKCVNTEHLELVTRKEHSLIHDLAGSRRDYKANQKKCKQGHALSGYNLITRKNGHRVCRLCSIERVKKWYKRRKIGSTKV